jgi:hypothetical protein
MNPQANFEAVVASSLARTRDRVPASESQIPLILQPARIPAASWLCAFLKEHSSSILDDISKHGAVLLREFDIQNHQ